jgi:hypothetical protein
MLINMKTEKALIYTFTHETNKNTKCKNKDLLFNMIHKVSIVFVLRQFDNIIQK